MRIGKFSSSIYKLASLFGDGQGTKKRKASKRKVRRKPPKAISKGLRKLLK
jgi:hypothetical protein